MHSLHPLKPYHSFVKKKMNRHTTPLNAPGLWGSRASCACGEGTPEAITTVMKGAAAVQGALSNAEYRHPNGQLYGRAPPPEMPQIGYLEHQAYPNLLGLFARRNPYSNRMEYYVQLNALGGSAGRIPLCTNEVRELTTGDGVEVPSQAGKWVVHLFAVRPIL
jgi:hypothetical protein